MVRPASLVVISMSDDPVDVDPSKYLADEPSLRFSKEKLYRLHWGYGLCIEHINAISDVGNGRIRERFRQYGIPMRSWREHTKWEPHHGVPPMFEWPDDRGEAESDAGMWASDYKKRQERKPEVGDV